MNGDLEKYEDIIELEHPEPKRHPRMKISDRAAQFSPFAALVGYDDDVAETARLTDEKAELDEDTKTILNEKMRLISDSSDKKSAVTVTYFVKDKRKAGGSYVSVTDSVLAIDEYRRVIVMRDKSEIPIDDVFEIEGDIFRSMY